MNVYKPFKGSLNPMNALGVIEFNKQFRLEHPEYFDPDGILVFCGQQGMGKTISAVSYTQRLIELYPEVVICSNIALQDQEGYSFVIAQNLEEGKQLKAEKEKETGKRCVIFIPYDNYEKLNEVRNGYGGVIFLIDEMHLEFNSLESKQMDSSIFYLVSQQRKQRIHIVGTAQVFGRLAKPFREQFKYAVICRCFFKFFQFNRLVDALKSEEKDGVVSAPGMKSFFWFHSSKLYESYDTLQLIKRTRNEWKG